ncbi:ABC-three component system middle component 1 [Cytobacillus sp. FSL W8-0315]|uniref:ABC-three component system middle component 1 n=1 Tax=Cytobacillus sp. FSL W8-0315 TaxID=2921600 RepID=UPI0030FBBC81
MANANFCDIIKNLFVELGYESKDYSYVDKGDTILENSFFARDLFRKNYYLVFFLSNDNKIEDIIKNQAKYFFLLKEFFGEDPDIDKNTSLLICIESSNENNKLSLNIEEDAYYFKKYVLTYSKEQLTSFITEYNSLIEEKGIKNVLEEIVNNVQLFEVFKLDPDINSVYKLITNIFIKIPILKVPMNEEKTVYSLSEVIETSLKNKELLNLKEKLDYLRENKIEDDTLLESLIELYKEEEVD